MDSDLNNFCQFLYGCDSNSFPPTTQGQGSRRDSVDLKEEEQFMSNSNNYSTFKIFHQNSPTPSKQNFSFQQEEHFHLQDSFEMMKMERRTISHVLNFSQHNSKKENKQQRFPQQFSSDVVPMLKNPSLKNQKQNRNSKGLRNLSQCVYKIVVGLKVTTYKQVAQNLVRMLNNGQFEPCKKSQKKTLKIKEKEDKTKDKQDKNQQDKNFQQIQDKIKDQMNIKRRVYDALNVLIAANVLKKNGKFVSSDQEVFVDKVIFDKKFVSDQQTLYEQLNKKTNLNKSKKDTILQLKQKLRILQALQKRNTFKKVPEKQETKIKFPLMGLIINGKVPKIFLKDSKSKANFSSENIVDIIGDLDLLARAGIDVMNEDLEEIIRETNSEDHESSVIIPSPSTKDSRGRLKSSWFYP